MKKFAGLLAIDSLGVVGTGYLVANADRYRRRECTSNNKNKTAVTKNHFSAQSFQVVKKSSLPFQKEAVKIQNKIQLRLQKVRKKQLKSKKMNQAKQ